MATWCFAFKLFWHSAAVFDPLREATPVAFALLATNNRAQNFAYDAHTYMIDFTRVPFLDSEIDNHIIAPNPNQEKR